MTVRAVQIVRKGGPNVLKLKELPSSPLGPSDIRIQVKAAGVNFADLMMRMGLYPEAPPLPFVPGYEVAGLVTKTGPQTSKFRVGDRVLGGCKFGGYASEIILPEVQVRKIPANLSFTEAAAIPVCFITAWLAIHDLARVRKGDRVVIPSAAGGVGTAAVQMSAQAGAYVIGLIGSPSKADVVKSLGATEVWTNDQWETSDGELFDVILEASGGKNLKRAYARLAAGGRLVSYGASTLVSGQKRSILKAIQQLSTTPFFHPLQLMRDTRGVFGLNVLQLFDPARAKLMYGALDQTLAKFENGNLRVLVGKTFPLSEAGAAHYYLQSRTNIGKVVLLIED